MGNLGDEFTRYVILLKRNPGVERTETLIRKHVQHLRELDRQGRLVLCGPFSDFDGGMIIIKAASLEEANNLASQDPFITEGFESCEVRTWKLSCEENNHMGMG